MASGLVILDKPSGLTSFECVEKVKDIYKEKKAGHTGTLDCKVTGVLLILIGEARKLAVFFEKAKKTYIGTMHLHKDASESSIREVLKKFTGEITQIPPVRSRVKRVPRKRKIYKLQIMEIKGRDVVLLIESDHGVYIRKLMHDIGEKLGTGAHMTALRRIGVNGFTEKEAVSLEDLKKNKEKYLIPNEKIIESLKIPKIKVPKDKEQRIRNGLPFAIKNKKLKDNEKVAIFVENKLLAIGVVKGKKIKINRVLN